MNNNQKLLIVMYHYTRDLVHSRYPKIKGLDLPLFRQQLEFFKNNFNVVTMEQVLATISTLPPSPSDNTSFVSPPPQGVLNEQNIQNKRSEQTGQTEQTEQRGLPENALLLTFDDGYQDNFTYALPLLEEFGFQGSFFIPGKTFTEHKLLDVNKIHYILASAENLSTPSAHPDDGINRLVTDLFERLDHYRGAEFNIPPNEELFNVWAVANRFDSKEVVFIKRILQTVLPEELRNRISSDLFEKYVGVSEEQLAYELYMTEDQIKTLKAHGHFIGLHGYDHYWLGSLDEAEMKADIDKALDVMEGICVINRYRWVISYPYGNWNDSVVEYIKNRNCVMGLTTDVRIANITADDSMKLPRLDCNDFPPKSKEFLRF